MTHFDIKIEVLLERRIYERISYTLSTNASLSVSEPKAPPELPAKQMVMVTSKRVRKVPRTVPLVERTVWKRRDMSDRQVWERFEISPASPKTFLYSSQ